MAGGRERVGSRRRWWRNEKCVKVSKLKMNDMLEDQLEKLRTLSNLVVYE